MQRKASRCRCLALKTSPIPPPPRRFRISYLPSSTVPGPSPSGLAIVSRITELGSEGWGVGVVRRSYWVAELLGRAVVRQTRAAPSPCLIDPRLISQTTQGDRRSRVRCGCAHAFGRAFAPRPERDREQEAQPAGLRGQ